MRVRAATYGDFDPIMNLYRQLQPDDPILDDETDRVVFKQIIQNDGLTIFVLEQNNGRLLSSCYVNVIPNMTRSASPYAVIENVITEASEQGKGYGKFTMAHALNHCWSAGCYKAMLLTGSNKKSTHAFYRSCGFISDDKTANISRPP